MYELLYIIPTPFTEKDIEGISKKVNNLIKELKGEINEEKNLGNKKFAYSIKQIYKGFYILVFFNIPKEKLEELNKKLKLITEILRHVIVKKVSKKITTKRRTKEKLGLEKLDKKINNL
ncbi:30S ribosomal protein S6 [Patescibacteria group bacterium]|nr:30S ribosomal protein S6 [Patescibacteria group bacterium]